MSNENKKMKRNTPIILHNFSDMDGTDKEPFNIYEYDVSITHVDDLNRELVKKNHELSEKTKKLREKKTECDELNRIINKFSEKEEEKEEERENILTCLLTKVHKYEELHKQTIQTLSQYQDKLSKEKKKNLLLLNEKDEQDKYIKKMNGKYTLKISDCNKLHKQYIDLKERYIAMKDYDPTNTSI